MLTKFVLSLMIVFAVGAHAQSPVPPSVAKTFTPWFDHLPKEPRLRCSIEPLRPFLDFAFRFAAGYLVHCPLRQFGGEEDTLATFIRITPAGRPPLLLGDRSEVPAMPLSMGAKTSLSKSNVAIDYSGGFNLGEGRYRVTMLITDDRNHFCTKTWRIHASLTRSEKAAPLAISPGEVKPLVLEPWEHPHPSRNGIRLTILLDAEPLRENSPELQISGRLLLLESLSSLLRQTPYGSVRLITFNLDQARQLFEQDHFDRAGFANLAQALSNLNLGTISYRALERQTWEHFLVHLVNGAMEAPDRPDAVVIMGPRTRLDARMPREMLEAPAGNGAQLFYFQYFPNWHRRAEFPDAITYLTKARGGTIFKIHSPGELARAIRKFAEDLNRTRH
ncbi:MAG: hypothetical protein ACRD4C_12120 [Candidatus Acidiferrales bacterium]